MSAPTTAWRKNDSTITGDTWDSANDTWDSSTDTWDSLVTILTPQTNWRPSGITAVGYDSPTVGYDDPLVLYDGTTPALNSDGSTPVLWRKDNP